MKIKNRSYQGSTESEVLLEVTLRGEYHPEQGTSDLRVFVGQHDITDQLSKYQLQSLGTDFEESMRDELEYGGEDGE